MLHICADWSIIQSINFNNLDRIWMDDLRIQWPNPAGRRSNGSRPVESATGCCHSPEAESMSVSEARPLLSPDRAAPLARHEMTDFIA